MTVQTEGHQGEILLAMTNVSKSFPGVKKALDRANLTVKSILFML